MPAPLPIDPLLPEIVEHLSRNPNAVIVAQPGAGKSTRVPPAVAAKLTGQTLLLQPRRVAARAVAQRIADEQGSAIGREVGYQIRFENRTSRSTRIVVMTEGILARRIQGDPFLEGVGAVILDEFHERNLHTDIALALLREIQSAVRPDLQIIVMSATLDAAPVSQFLDDARIFEAEGRTYPLTIKHAPRHDSRPLEIRMTQAIQAAISSAPSPAAPHVLAFLPGMGEIRRVSNALPASLPAMVHVLHSSVSPADQQAALAPSSQPKVILATNIAETSLTIDGVGTVIDSGLARTPVHDNRLGFDRLETRRISKASAAQRAGRAGRSHAGTCYRLYTAEEHSAMADFEAPEIQRLDLAGIILMLKAYGVGRIDDFGWFEAPRADAVSRAAELLSMLGALDMGGRLTAWGKALAALPLHPRLGSVFLYGVKAGHADETAWLCALLEAADLSPATGTRSQSHDSDALDRLGEVLRDQRSAPWPVRNAAGQLARLASQLEIQPGASRRIDRDTALRQALLRGYPDRVVKRRATGDARGVMVGRRGIKLAAQSRVAGAELLVALDTREVDGASETLVYSASSIDAAWLPQLFPGLYRDEETVRVAGGKALGVRRQMFADLVLSEKDMGRLPAGFDAAAVLQAQLLDQHGSAMGCLLADDDAARWIARYAFLRRHMQAAPLPELDSTAALEAACAGCRSVADVRKNLLPVLQGMAPGAARLMSEHAPEFLMLPTGNRARITYPPVDPATGDSVSDTAPAVAARVQELFGLAESPRLAGGTVPLVVELLSPARRPVQITRDLKSFWNTTYQEVRKELRARYPKHPWPEDPWTAPPVSVGRRRG